MELLKSTTYKREYLHPLSNGTYIEFRALSYKELNNIRGKYTNHTNTLTINIIKTALLNKEEFSLLTQSDIYTMYNTILDVSTILAEEVDAITTAVGISLEETFNDDTFRSCELCRERKLDTKRNCPYLPKDTHDNMVFYIVDSTKVTVCPMKEVNSQLVSDAFRCYNITEQGYLPEAGGLYDQTIFFVETSSLVKGLINRHTNKELNKK